MGDRHYPIKFGPEWLRNFSRDGATAGTSGTTPNNSLGQSNSGAAGGSEAGGPSRPTTTNPKKVHLAKLRYGREEMLALCERNMEPPAELKHFDSLYIIRGKAPYALHNPFEEMMRDNSSSRISGAAMQNDRFAASRTQILNDGRQRSRMPFPKPQGTRWQGNNTNWRRHPWRDEGAEWRNLEGGTSTGSRPTSSTRPAQYENKWSGTLERDQWGEATKRGSNVRAQWNTKRSWSVVENSPNEETLPEWAVDTTETYSGTFDAQGAFHGSSNDDSSLPKPPAEPTINPLMRSHTHGNLTRVRQGESSEEWWASEKARKLSAKRFPTTTNDANVKMQSESSTTRTSEPRASRSNTVTRSSSQDCLVYPEQIGFEEPPNSNPQYFLIRRNSAKDVAEARAEGSGVQSVMIAPTNSLRQRHQNIVGAAGDTMSRISPTGMPHGLLGCEAPPQPELEVDPQTIVDKMMELSFEEPRQQGPIPMPSQSKLVPPVRSDMAPVAVPRLIRPMMAQLAMPPPTGHGPFSHTMQMPSLRQAPTGVMPQPQFAAANPHAPMPYHGVPSSSLFARNAAGIPMPPNGDVRLRGRHPQEMQPERFAMPQTSFNGPPVFKNSLAEQWFYEDPEGKVQGPFTSQEMYYWLQCGFFTSSLMLRRGCEPHMRPLGSYGPVAPFITDLMNHLQMAPGYEARSVGDVMPPMPHVGHPDIMQYGDVGSNFLRHPTPASFGQHQNRESLWSDMGPTTNGSVWQKPEEDDDEHSYLWPPSIAPNTVLPEDIVKEIKTEDEILAQLRASQPMGQTGVPFPNKEPAPFSSQSELKEGATPHLGELEKFIPKQPPAPQDAPLPVQEHIIKSATDLINDDGETSGKQPAASTEPKASKSKSDEKPAKGKETATKAKKKSKEDSKKDDAVEQKKDDEKTNDVSKIKTEELVPLKTKKEEKVTKKDLEKEKKEWIKEGFTIVKGADKTVNKEKKKAEEYARAAEEAEQKRTEEEKLAAEDEKRKQTEALKKQQEQQQLQGSKALESVSRRAPWSSMAPTGPTFAEIQRLEREKKLEQMKEQQAMMQIIAQQQQAALHREQEVQAGLGWAKFKGNGSTGPRLASRAIQAEARKQALTGASELANAHTLDKGLQAPPVAVPWANTHNGVIGFWETDRAQALKPEVAKQPEPKKKPVATATATSTRRKDTSPVDEFDTWCNSALASWAAKIDVPTFIGFLKDIESPFEVKEYAKCYLGDTKESNDFARLFLEKRSKLLRGGPAAPADDLCSKAAAVKARIPPGQDYQDAKGKGKKAKKNKMLKVDARILGFSVTASEDRINVGDIDPGMS